MKISHSYTYVYSISFYTKNEEHLALPVQRINWNFHHLATSMMSTLSYISFSSLLLLIIEFE